MTTPRPVSSTSAAAGKRVACEACLLRAAVAAALISLFFSAYEFVLGESVQRNCRAASPVWWGWRGCAAAWWRRRWAAHRLWCHEPHVLAGESTDGCGWLNLRFILRESLCY